MSLNNEGNLEVTIENKMEHKEENKKEHYLRREFNYSNYQQVYVLPEDVVKDNIAAKVDIRMGISIPQPWPLSLESRCCRCGRGFGRHRLLWQSRAHSRCYDL